VSGNPSEEVGKATSLLPWASVRECHLRVPLASELPCVQMHTDKALEGVEIEFWVDWYDGPVSGVAAHEGHVYWFEAEPGFEPVFLGRKLFLYPLTAEELAKERELDRIYREQAKDRLVEAWPAVLRERDWELPTKYAKRANVGWFLAP
jgi:hypothetical protein